MLRKWAVLIPFMLSSLALGQAYRVDNYVQTLNTNVPVVNNMYPVLAIPGSTVVICNAPANAVPCTNYASTYTSATGLSLCPNSTQFTRPGTNICVAKADSTGAWGAWVGAGNYQYTITTPWGTSSGPYDLSVGGGGGTTGLPVANPTYTGAMNGPTFNGFRYASQWQSPLSGGNNGISNALSANQTVIADPNYGLTEIPSWNTFTSYPVHYWDTRDGADIHYFRNPSFFEPATSQFPPIAFSGASTYAARNLVCQFDTTQPTWGGGNLHQACYNINYVNSIPGWSFGYDPAFGSGSNWAQGWKVDHGGFNIQNSVFGSGITETFSISQFKNGVGDNAVQYNYVTGQGGYTAFGDEGTKAYAGNVIEAGYAYIGTCNTGCTTGSTSIKTTGTQGVGYQGTGRYLIDTTQAPVSQGRFTAVASGIAGGLTSAITVDQTVPVSTAWGTLQANVPTPVQPLYSTNPPFTTSETFNVVLTSGTFTVGTLVCFEGAYHEQAIPTAVGTPSGGVQSITVPLRKNHAAGVYIFQGGMCGGGFENSSQSYNTIASTTNKYLFDVFGSTDSHTLQVQYYKGGLPAAFTGITPQNFTINAANISSSGTTVTVTNINNGTLANPSWYKSPNANFYFSGSSDSALNNSCTNVVWSTTTAFTCNISGLTGTHTTTTTVTVILDTNKYTVWQMAEVLDVQNEAVNPPTVDGSLILEPNNIPFTTSDSVQEPHHTAGNWGGQTLNVFLKNPFANLLAGLTVTVNNEGAVGTGDCNPCKSIVQLGNGQPSSWYLGGGGIYIPPNMIGAQGPFFDLITSQGPGYGAGGMLNVFLDSSTQAIDPTYSMNWFRAIGLSSQTWTQLSFQPSSKITTYYNQGGMNFTGGPVGLPASSTINGKGLAGAGTSIPTGPASATANDLASLNSDGSLSDSGHFILAGITPLLGGSALTAGTCSSTTVTVTGANTGMAVSASSSSGTDAGDGFYLKAFVSSSNTVTVKICAAVAGTPTAMTYNVRVIQ